MTSQGLRLQYILNELKITPYRFSKLLGYKSPDTIYHILNEKQKVSTMMQSKIRELNLEINENWIITGDGYPFIKKLTKGSYGNEYSINGEIIYPARLNFNSIVKLVRKLISDIYWYMDGKSYEVKYRVSGIEGLEFIITELGFEEGERYESKYYSLIMSPEWKIISYFDFWGLFESRIRCQNLLKTRKVFEKPFEFKTREFIDELTVLDIRNKSDKNEILEKYSVLYINNPDNLGF